MRNEGTVFPIGTWTGHETWQEISGQLAKRQVKFPDGTILVCDGEIGLAESLSKLASDEQRCFRATVELVCLINGQLGNSPEYDEAFKDYI